MTRVSIALRVHKKSEHIEEILTSTAMLISSPRQLTQYKM